jgi:hypothetical protein
MGTVVLLKRGKKGKASVTVADVFEGMLGDVFNANVATVNVSFTGYMPRSY